MSAKDVAGQDKRRETLQEAQKGNRERLTLTLQPRRGGGHAPIASEEPCFAVRLALFFDEHVMGYVMAQRALRFLPSARGHGFLLEDLCDLAHVVPGDDLVFH